MKEQSIVHTLNNNARDRKRRMNTHRKASKNELSSTYHMCAAVRAVIERTHLIRANGVSRGAGDAN